MTKTISKVENKQGEDREQFIQEVKLKNLRNYFNLIITLILSQENRYQEKLD